MSRGPRKMLIGELGRRSGLTPDTIRFYEKMGLLDARHMTRKDNNYKDYGPEALERLRLVSHVKCSGFTLSEIERWLQEWDKLDAVGRRKVVQDKVKQIEDKIAEMEEMKAHLIATIPACLAESSCCR